MSSRRWANGSTLAVGLIRDKPLHVVPHRVPIAGDVGVPIRVAADGRRRDEAVDVLDAERLELHVAAGRA